MTHRYSALQSNSPGHSGRLGRWLISAGLLLAVAIFASHTARAAAAYQGIYVVVDPYDQYTIGELQSAAQTPCTPAQQTVTTPFCGATNGLLIRLPWCDFQLYHLRNSKGAPLPSCHYVVGWANGSSGPGLQIPSTDNVSPCNGSYDICTGAARSVLGGTLHLITQINTQRMAAGLPPLNLSIGMYAGDGTPQGVLDSVGYVDVPFSNSASGDPTANQCLRLPLHWKPQFVTAYEQASSQLLSYIKSQFSSGANITMVKPAAMTGDDLEVFVPGKTTFIQVAADPGPAGAGPVLSCPTGNGNAAQVWLNAYSQSPVANENFSEAQESTFGTVVGYYWATLANLGLTSAILSVPTTNGGAFPYIDCGSQGNLPCAIKGASNWSVYYLDRYIVDLFNGGLAYTQAAAAYNALRSDTFSLAPTQFSVNATNLTTSPVPSAQQVECTLNNTSATNATNFNLDGVNTLVTGVGTMLGWQTGTLQGPECAAGTYGQALQNGINDGALFEEIETDAAFTDIAQCAAPLSNALKQLLAAPPPTSCVY